jgi:hypothetical protein
MTTFPAQALALCVDGHDVYCVVNEERENWFDWSREGLNHHYFKVAYRCHIPD